MATLKDIVSLLRSELSKDSDLDRTKLLELTDRLEPMATSDWARIKRLQKRTELFSGRNTEEIEQSLSELEKIKADLEQHRNLLAERDQLLETRNKEYLTREKTLQDDLAQERAAMERLVIDSGLTSELVNANAKSSLIGAAKALIREKGILRLDRQGPAVKAAVVETRDGKEVKRELGEWVKDFLASEEGREFVAAKPNAGSGASDARSGVGSQTQNGMTEDTFYRLPARERAAYMAKGGTLITE